MSGKTAQWTVSVDLPCLRCGYNLRDLTEIDACPECNLPVARTLRGDFLIHAAPRRRALAHAGLGLALLGVLLWEVRLLALIGAIWLSGDREPPQWFFWLELALGPAAAALSLAGICCITARDRASPAGREARLVWTARLAFAAALAGETLILAAVVVEETIGLQSIVSSPLQRWFAVLALLTALGAFAGWIAGPTATSVLLTRLAPRLADAPARRLAKLMRWLIPALAVGLPFLAWGIAEAGGERLIPIVPLTLLVGLGGLWVILLYKLRRGAGAAAKS